MKTIAEKFLSYFAKNKEKFTKIKSSHYTIMLYLKNFKVQKTKTRKKLLK